MSQRGLAPAPVLLAGLGAVTLAFVAKHPLVIGAVLLGALLVHWSTRAGRIPLIVGAVIGLGTALINPFVQANGDLIVVELPDIPILDMQITFEELVAGAVIGAQAFAVTLLVNALILAVDPDRLLAGASRLAPRSALTAAIAARSLPTLQRDARALGEAAALRGQIVTSGPRRQRIATAGRLTLPLVGSALERSLDVAEAMAVRGYGGDERTRVREEPLTRRDRMILLIAVPILGLAIAAIVSQLGSFRFYPTLEPLTGRSAVVTALATVVSLGALAGRLRR